MVKQWVAFSQLLLTGLAVRCVVGICVLPWNDGRATLFVSFFIEMPSVSSWLSYCCCLGNLTLSVYWKPMVRRKDEYSFWGYLLDLFHCVCYRAGCLCVFLDSVEEIKSCLSTRCFLYMFIVAFVAFSESAPWSTQFVQKYMEQQVSEFTWFCFLFQWLIQAGCTLSVFQFLGLCGHMHVWGRMLWCQFSWRP